MTSTYEQRDNSGNLFKNKRREKDSHPNATGKAMIGGRIYYISAWTKRDRNGEPFQSLSFKPVDDCPSRREPVGAPLVPADIIDDEIPF